MKVTEPEVSLQYTALYQATVRHAVAGAPELMQRLVAHARAVLRTQEEVATDRRERERVADARHALNRFEPLLHARFAEELNAAFTRAASVEHAQPASAMPALHFDRVADMDEAALRQRVEQAGRGRREALAASADAALDELNACICAAAALPELRLENNPLRSAVFAEGITATLAHLPVPGVMRQGWITLMVGALGQELGPWYRGMADTLRRAAREPLAHPAEEPPPMQHGRPTLLTLERLRALLTTDPMPAAPGEAAAQRPPSGPAGLYSESAAAPLDDVATGFQPTVPAVYEAVRDPRDFRQLVQRLERRRSGAAPPDPQELQQFRERARATAQGLEHSLGLEVVALMVDNIAHDPRLLSPVQSLVARLEPALLRLAHSDPRFFSHKQHPARRLLQEITRRSIAFESVDSRGFSGFMEPLQEALAPLAASGGASAEDFDRTLTQLQALWDDPQARDKRQHARAVRALKKAEQRNALAATLAMDVLARPEAAQVPDAVIEFLCGPWAQVVAHARMSDRGGASDPGQYGATVEDILWSAQPHLTRHKVADLTRLVPRLLAQLRAGLASIDYPAQKTSEFFEVLMHLQQRGFKPQAEGAGGPGRAAAPERATREHERRRRLGERVRQDCTWVAPAEARASGFIDMLPDAPVGGATAGLGGLQVGAWVALHADGGWTRTQVSWVSGNGALFLFADALGFLQSLTRPACEQLLRADKLRLIAADPVEDALDAVARTALRNSVDVRV